MKVAMVSKAFVRGTYQRGLEELAQIGVDLILITPPSWREGQTITPLERRYVRGYRMVETPIVLNGHYHVHFYPRLGKILQEFRPDIVHVDEEPYNLATFLGLLNARRVGARGLFYSWQNLHRTLPLPFALIERANYQLAEAAIAANEDAAGVLKAKGFRRPIAVIPPGLDPRLYVQRDRPDPNNFHIGYVGRLVYEKGLDLLIRACRTLGGPWSLTIVGGGDQEASLRGLASDLGVAGSIEFRSAVPSGDVPAILRDFDVLVLPSRGLPNWREQFGRILMEAMACEVPVVGSSCGEIPKVIGDGGLVFPEGDFRELASRLRLLQEDVELRNVLGARGRERVMDLFTHQRVAEKTLAVYRSLLETST